MRKSLIIIAILLALSLGVIVSAVTAMDAQHENITITEETLYGDPAAAEGLSVSTRVDSERHLYWDTTYMACADPQPVTDFIYSDERLYEEYEDTGSFYLQLAHLNSGMSGRWESIEDLENIHGEEFDMDSPHLMKPVLDVESRTKPGEERKEIIRLADYYDDFPLGFHFMARDGFLYRENEQSLWKYLNNYFRIPVPEDLELEVTVSKDEAGFIYNIDYYEVSGLGSSYTTCYSPSVVRQDGVFFGLCGNVDFSRIEGGYGIYYMPVAKNEKIAAIDGQTGETVPQVYLTQRIENIYPMDPADCEEMGIYLSADGQQVYAFTKEQGEVILTVFDSETCEIIQQFQPDIGQLPTLWCQDNIVALITGDEAWENFFLQVYLVEDGKLTLWLDTDMFHAGDKGPYWYMDAELCFDGQRLAIAQYHDNWNVATHRILIYDQTGLQYAGDFHHSGDDLPDRLRTWENGLQLQWK